MTDYDPIEHGDAPIARTQDIFDKMDTNQDGVLSKDEFVRGCLNDERLYKLLACSNEGEQPTPTAVDDIEQNWHRQRVHLALSLWRNAYTGCIESIRPVRGQAIRRSTDNEYTSRLLVGMTTL